MAESDPHVENCPGCVADKLAEEDRQYLRSTGWVDPEHVFAPKPRMAPAGESGGVAWIFVVVGALIFAGALLNSYPVFTVIAAGVLIALWSWHLYMHKTQHGTAREIPSGCGTCRREDRRKAEGEWARYRMLVAKDAARREAEAHAADYARRCGIEGEHEWLRREQGWA